MDGTLRGEIQRRWEGDDQLEMTREEREREKSRSGNKAAAAAASISMRWLSRIAASGLPRP